MNRRGRVQCNPGSRAWYVARAACPATPVLTSNSILDKCLERRQANCILLTRMGNWWLI